jgi:Ssp1 endopeptidase immunity protein Rap1a
MRIFLVIALCSFAGWADAEVMSGEELHKLSAAYGRMNDRQERDASDALYSGEFIGYVHAVVDVGVEVKQLCRPPSDVSMGQIAATVKLYLDQHPQRWNDSGWILTIEALREVFPCKR